MESLRVRSAEPSESNKRMKTTDLNALHADAKSAIAGMVQRLHGKPAAGDVQIVPAASPRSASLSSAQAEICLSDSSTAGKAKSPAPLSRFDKTPNTVTCLEGLRGLVNRHLVEAELYLPGGNPTYDNLLTEIQAIPRVRNPTPQTRNP